MLFIHALKKHTPTHVFVIFETFLSYEYLSINDDASHLFSKIAKAIVQDLHPHST